MFEKLNSNHDYTWAEMMADFAITLGSNKRAAEEIIKLCLYEGYKMDEIPRTILEYAKRIPEKDKTDDDKYFDRIGI